MEDEVPKPKETVDIHLPNYNNPTPYYFSYPFHTYGENFVKPTIIKTKKNKKLITYVPTTLPYYYGLFNRKIDPPQDPFDYKLDEPVYIDPTKGKEIFDKNPINGIINKIQIPANYQGMYTPNYIEPYLFNNQNNKLLKSVNDYSQNMDDFMKLKN